MLKLFEYFKLDDRVQDLYNRVRAELVSKGHEEVWNHTKRVVKNLYLISEFFEFDFKKALVAAICHDIGYNEVVNTHERASAQMMKDLLDGMYDSVFVSEVLHCIESHECDNGLIPQTSEAMALHDADMLDYVGEWGLINAFLLGKNVGLSDSKTAMRIIKVIEEGFLIEAISKEKSGAIKHTEQFFNALINDLSLERSDFKKYGIK